MKIKKYPFSGVLVRLENLNHIKFVEKRHGNELHVNLWDFESDAILDVGLLLHKEETFGKIFIDIPWHLKHENILDIASKIDGERILKAVFNRDVGYISSESHNPKVVFPDEKGKDFYLVRLNNTVFKVKHYTLPGGAEVSTIEITLPDSVKKDFASDGPDRFYIRFRLVDVPKEVFGTIFTQKDRNLLSSCVHATVFDCRLNTRRGIPEEIISPAASKLDFPDFQQIHLFLVVHRDREPTFQSQSFKACRSLEDENVWNEYIRLDGELSDHHVEEVKNYLGYQWSIRGKGGESAKELVALARFTRVFTDRWIMIRFIVIALLLGATGNGIWELVLEFVGHYPKIPESYSRHTAVIILLLTALFVYLIPESFLRYIEKHIKGLTKRICKLLCCKN